MDCMEAMRNMPDKAFYLALVDPPYGGGATQGLEEDLKNTNTLRGGGTKRGRGRTGQGVGVSLTSTKLKQNAQVAPGQRNMVQKLSTGILLQIKNTLMN